MKKKIGLVKIAVVAAFLALFAAPIFFSSALKISAYRSSETDSENTQNCAACHRESYNSQHQSSHQKSVRKASSETINGDFTSEYVLEYNGVKVLLTRGGENFFVRIGDENYRIAAVVGVKYIEQYVAEKDGEFYVLPVAYNLSERRWINLGESVFEKKDAGFSRHLENWKTDCAACHQSGENNFSDGFNDNFGISCAACHGNAAEHLASKNSVWAKLGFQTENRIVNPRNLSSDAAIMVCAQCHAREANDIPKFEEIVVDQEYAAPVSAHQTNAADAGKYWANDANKFSGNEYQSLLRSVCYRQSKAGGHGIAGEKINCSSCHLPHDESRETAAISKPPNQNCIQCHAQFADGAAIVEHTKHPLDSAASSCASCHQPETVYGRMRFYQTHEISVPNPSLTVEKQIPNACNLCHLDKSANWAIAASKKLWSERFRDSKTSTDKRYDQPEGVRALSSDDALTRALTADAMRKHAELNWSVPILSEALRIEESALVKSFITAALNNNPSKPAVRE